MSENSVVLMGTRPVTDGEIDKWWYPYVCTIVFIAQAGGHGSPQNPTYWIGDKSYSAPSREALDDAIENETVLTQYAYSPDPAHPFRLATRAIWDMWMENNERGEKRQRLLKEIVDLG